MLTAVRLGILGGTFDPPHIAHLYVGEVAYRQLGLDQVLFMPSGVPWQKLGRSVSTSDHRLRMTELSITGMPHFAVDDRETHREGWTYTADTLATFDISDEVVLILGADAAVNLPTWQRADEVLSRAKIAVAPRPGVDIDRVAGALGSFETLDTVEIGISGTMLRERAATGRPIRFLVAEPVWSYIEELDLYRGPSPTVEATVDQEENP